MKMYKIRSEELVESEAGSDVQKSIHRMTHFRNILGASSYVRKYFETIKNNFFWRTDRKANVQKS